MDRGTICRGRSASIAALALACLASACGGGGGSAPPAATNRAPTFSSSSAASVAENATGTVYTAMASDPDGDALTYAISGGTDAAAFTLSGSALTFVVAPNFDQPTDGNLDNAYQLTLSASDGRGGTINLPLTVTVTNDHEGVNLTRVASGFGADAVLVARDRGSGLLLISQDGLAREIDAASGAATAVGNVFKPGESGRVLAAGYLNGYGVAMLDIAGRGVIVRTIPLPDSSLQYVVEADLGASPSNSARGTLFIGGDSLMFGALGDANGDRAQDAASGYGKFYRVQVDPYCGASTLTYCIYGELFGDGVHAPAGGGGYNHQSFLLDRGTGQQEEVTYFNQNARPLDFGWPYREGTFERVANPPPAVNGPSVTYAHGSGFFEGRGLTGGVNYTGAIASLTNRIVLADESGKIFAFPAHFLADGILHSAREMENRTADFAPATGAIERPVAIVLDGSGRLFVLDGDGELYATS